MGGGGGGGGEREREREKKEREHAYLLQFGVVVQSGHHLLQFGEDQIFLRYCQKCSHFLWNNNDNMADNLLCGMHAVDKNDGIWSQLGKFHIILGIFVRVSNELCDAVFK